MAVSSDSAAFLVVQKGLSIWASVKHAVDGKDGGQCRMDQTIDLHAILMAIVSVQFRIPWVEHPEDYMDD